MEIHVDKCGEKNHKKFTITVINNPNWRFLIPAISECARTQPRRMAIVKNGIDPQKWDEKNVICLAKWFDPLDNSTITLIAHWLSYQWQKILGLKGRCWWGDGIRQTDSVNSGQTLARQQQTPADKTSNLGLSPLVCAIDHAQTVCFVYLVYLIMHKSALRAQNFSILNCLRLFNSNFAATFQF